MENRFIPNKPIDETTVVVAMSGGVDSSVVATLLHKEGYRVIGATMQLYDHGIALEKKGACCAGQDIYDAKMVADRMGFPHYVLNYESVFKEDVMEDFADSYLRGETPIPCVKCNQSVKFRDMFTMAKDLGADALATGHYIRRKIDPEDGTQLHRAIDESKDQSYFLFATTKEQLDFIHFPLGGLHKEETRKLATEYGLDIANKPDSQDICFVPNGSYTSVIERLRPDAFTPGDIMHVDGQKIGEHQGIAHYTIGQRKGINANWPTPLYVIKVDANNHQVWVGPDSALGANSCELKDVNWLGNKPPEDYDNITVKLRSSHSGCGASITLRENQRATVHLHEKQRAITPGQACVIYQGSQVLGGGWITNNPLQTSSN